MFGMDALVPAFAHLAQISYEEACGHTRLVEIAMGDVLNLLKPEVDLTEHRERILGVCAANAYCNYCMINCLSHADKVELEGIRIATDSEKRYQQAKEVRKQQLLMISDLLKTSGAAFEGVKINVSSRG